MTCFMIQKSIRAIMSQKKSNIIGQEKPTLFILEDINICHDNISFDVIEYLNLLKLNNFTIFNPDYQEM